MNYKCPIVYSLQSRPTVRRSFQLRRLKNAGCNYKKDKAKKYDKNEFYTEKKKLSK